MGEKAQLLCAECLGLLGAVDPARLDVKAAPPESLHSLTLTLLTELISKHLVRLLRVASSLPVLEATTFAIQVSAFHCSWARAVEPKAPIPSNVCRRTPTRLFVGSSLQILLRLFVQNLHFLGFLC